MNRPKTVGVIGGMGPAATAEFFRRLIIATPATRDDQHLRVLIDSDPRIPARTAAILHGGPDPAPRLREIARGLEAAGAELLTMPCNTAHAYLNAIRDAVSIPVLDMLEEATAKIEKGPVGLLATTATVRLGLYQDVGRRRGLDVLVPDEERQADVTHVIAALKAYPAPEPLRKDIGRVVGTLQASGARAILVGCTELSLLGRVDESLVWVDALDALVEATVRDAFAVHRN
ncbi:MAG: amino acid racemase [Thermotogota bacterium]